MYVLSVYWQSFEIRFWVNMSCKPSRCKRLNSIWREIVKFLRFYISSKNIVTINTF